MVLQTLYPGAIDTTTSLGQVANRVASTIGTGGVTAIATTIPVTDTTGAPADGAALISAGTAWEIVSYTGKTASSITGATRGFDGSTAAAWAAGDAIRFDVITSAHHEALRGAIIATETELDAVEAAKAPLASPTFTGTVAGITKAMVGLGSVDNTSDAGKPVSTAGQTALDLKANLASPTFTGTVAGITKSMVGLGNVDNTSDATKDAATATLANKTLTTPTIAATGFTNANHTHAGATTGGTIAHTDLTSIGTNSHAQIDTHIAAANPHSGSAASNHGHYAQDITIGTMATARLGSGTADTTTYLRGDQTWATPAGGGGSSITRVSGNSGAAGADITWQTLSADAASNSTTTPATVMTTTGVGAGTWLATYTVRYQSAATTTGVKFRVNHSGTTAWVTMTSSYQTTGGAAATGAADQATTTAAQMTEGWSARAMNQDLGPSFSVDFANGDMLQIIEVHFDITATGDLTLAHASEVAAASTVKLGTCLELRKID